MSKRSARTSVTALPPADAQILHNAKSEAQDNPSPADSSPQSPGQTVADPVNRRVSEILDQLAAGLRADDEMESDRLTLARNGGSLVLELKKIVPFGKYMDKLKERFPKSSYHKLHRCRFLAEHDAEVEATLQAYPDVAWGPTKMIAHLKGLGSPGSGTGQDEEGEAGDQDGDPEENTGLLLEKKAGGEAEADDYQEGEESNSDSVQEQQSETRTEGSTGAAEKKYEKLMGRFGKGGDMHQGGTTTKKTAEPTSYRVTVVTQEKGDLEKFGALLPSPIIDLKAHSVSGWVRLLDIGSILASVGSALSAASLKKVRIVVELVFVAKSECLPFPGVFKQIVQRRLYAKRLFW